MTTTVDTDPEAVEQSLAAGGHGVSTRVSDSLISTLPGSSYVDAGVFTGGPPDLDFADDLRADFEFGLALLLDGAAAHIARRAPGQASKAAR